MTLHPITVVDQVLDEYRSYLSTEFRASDKALRQALDDALDEPGFLSQEPFFQAHRPFKSGARWDALGLEPELARVMEARAGVPHAYLHQSRAISRLLAGSDAGPVVVTTGTGSGKTECFLLPVIQNAIEDARCFPKKSGLTAILVYPMNALANDQQERIDDFLKKTGHTYVKVARYDRSTKQQEREELRRNPPHILLTNYMMLEYLLVRPADRDGLFANHRCRFLVLDEVHTYRGSLGANIALLFRRLRAHLRTARQDWRVNLPGGNGASRNGAAAGDDTDESQPRDPRRFPEPLVVATSATIKSIDEQDKSRDEVRKLRDAAVQEFLWKLTGEKRSRFLVLSEELEELGVPLEAAWPADPAEVTLPNRRDDDTALRSALAGLAGAGASDAAAQGIDLETVARRTAILWKLNELLARTPQSLSQLVERIAADVPERAGTDRDALRREVRAALAIGAALPEDTPGALRLRAHRFIRGGWRFMRCVDPQCGSLHPMGEETCACGRATAPLCICRSCGADALRFKTENDDLENCELIPNSARTNDNEWILYDRERFETAHGEDLVGTKKQMRGRKVREGSFDPATCSFAADAGSHPLKVVLAPARNRCLVCGGTAGARDVLTPVALSTSAAVRVLAEGLVEGLAAQNVSKPNHDGKERLLIFSDSRQDAAHQARFISYAGRYDRMRRRVVRCLDAAPAKQLDTEELLTALVDLGVERRDNPHCAGCDEAQFLSRRVRARASAWEEAPLLDDLAVSAGYRATLFNLGLVGVRYQHLDDIVRKHGEGLCVLQGLDRRGLVHLCRCLLDEIRRQGALSRPLLTYHPMNSACPEEYQEAADWERAFKQPSGYPCDEDGKARERLEAAEVPDGIVLRNAWRKMNGRGRGPGLEHMLRRLVERLGGCEPTADSMKTLLEFLQKKCNLIVDNTLFGYRDKRKLLQVNADALLLELLAPEDRFACSICNVRMPWAGEGLPCPRCPGVLMPWDAAEVDGNRYVQRIRQDALAPLIAGEHTAQVTGDARIELEADFKGGLERSPINVLACSPTLEMGIDVGGLDAVVMRNVPPRPDNYAQRGGRAGRRSRVGIVLGYARSTPHDGYFFDKPAEMIAGEVPAPAVGLGNRDVVLRHLHALAFGGAEPGLAGRMAEYITIKGEAVQETIDELIAAVTARFDDAVQMALDAWGAEILEPAGLNDRAALRAALDDLPHKIGDLFDRVRLQILNLDETIKRLYDLGKINFAAVHAQNLARKLLGIRDERYDRGGDADDRSGGHPMRRFAEFGILPGYEFPSEPATLRLWRDDNEDEPVTVTRRFGIAQYQPNALVHARGHRWRVKGLDMASPWNPRSPEPDWLYVLCKGCGLRYEAQTSRCPRCGSDEMIGGELPGHEYGGFVAMREDTPVLQEEDRFPIASLVKCFPQRNGKVIGRFRLATGWCAALAQGESVRWLNEWKPPTGVDLRFNRPFLHEEGRGFYLCPSCGQTLEVPDEGGTDGKGDKGKGKGKGRRKARKAKGADIYGHAPTCELKGQKPVPLAITTMTPATTLRIEVVVPKELDEQAYEQWGWSLGYALRTGARWLYMLDGAEIEFLLEPIWEAEHRGKRLRKGALTFIDAAVGGSGFLERAAAEFHLVAARAIDHLVHPNCESACYRCLKTYTNQRHHEFLSWPRILPDLEQLTTARPDPLPHKRGDADDPTPWLQAYDAGVGSPLELKFLKLFEKYGLEVEKQVPVAVAPGEKVISQADFQVSGTNVLIYVDGAAFHHGKNLRRDRIIRQRLRDADQGWQIVELRAKDLKRGKAVADEIRGMIE